MEYNIHNLNTLQSNLRDALLTLNQAKFQIERIQLEIDYINDSCNNALVQIQHFISKESEYGRSSLSA